MNDEVMKDELNEEEQEILEAFQQGGLVPAPNVKQAIEEARRAARNSRTERMMERE